MAELAGVIAEPTPLLTLLYILPLQSWLAIPRPVNIPFQYVLSGLYLSELLNALLPFILWYMKALSDFSSGLCFLHFICMSRGTKCCLFPTAPPEFFCLVFNMFQNTEGGGLPQIKGMGVKKRHGGWLWREKPANGFVNQIKVNNILRQIHRMWGLEEASLIHSFTCYSVEGKAIRCKVFTS